MLMRYPARSRLLFSKVLRRSFKPGLYHLASVSAFPLKQRPGARNYAMASDSLTSPSNDNATMHPEPKRTYEVVVAATRDLGIGREGKLPWTLPSDMKFFKEITTTTSESGKRNAVIMGRRTWESIPLKYRPLPDRLNVVLTRSGTSNVTATENVVICQSIPSALKLLAAAPYHSFVEKLFIIGGSEIIRESLNEPECDAIHITEIETGIKCDTFIPPIDLSLYHLQHSSEPVLENGIRFSFATYVRKKGMTTGNTTAGS